MKKAPTWLLIGVLIQLILLFRPAGILPEKLD